MTPKEKAKELIDKFHIKVLDRDGTSAMNEFEAKQCALVAVSVILDEFDHLAWHDDDYAEYKMKYWQEVKQEIEKL